MLSSKGILPLMATFFQFPYGPAQTPDNITGLASGQAKVLGSVGDGSLIFDIVVAPLMFTTGAGGVGTVELWVALSENGGAPPTGIWSGGIDPTSTADQSAKVIDGQVRLLHSITAASATTYYFDWFSQSAVIGGFAMYSCYIVWNKTAAALNATASNFAARFSRQNFSSPVPLVYA